MLLITRVAWRNSDVVKDTAGDFSTDFRKQGFSSFCWKWVQWFLAYNPNHYKFVKAESTKYCRFHFVKGIKHGVLMIHSPLKGAFAGERTETVCEPQQKWISSKIIPMDQAKGKTFMLQFYIMFHHETIRIWKL